MGTQFYASLFTYERSFIANDCSSGLSCERDCIVTTKRKNKKEKVVGKSSFILSEQTNM